MTVILYILAAIAVTPFVIIMLCAFNLYRDFGSGHWGSK